MPFQLHKLSFKIINLSTILLPTWRSILNELKMKQKMLLHDVATRWNSTYDMLVVALEYKKAVKQITTDNEDVGDHAAPEFKLTLKEWKIAEQLCDILKVWFSPHGHHDQVTGTGYSGLFLTHLQILKDVTLFFSCSMPNLTTVIPAMDHIYTVFTTQSLNTDYDPAIQASRNIAKKTLNC